MDPVWMEVQRSNMHKIGPDGVVVRRPDGKILKPEGWRAPDIDLVLSLQKPRV
jgi:predicted HAD superfamily Cof-like phosphohydrolase